MSGMTTWDSYVLNMALVAVVLFVLLIVVKSPKK
jgi:hypothetical protein